jgi:hypothetical protein
MAAAKHRAAVVLPVPGGPDSKKCEPGIALLAMTACKNPMAGSLPTTSSMLHGRNASGHGNDEHLALMVGVFVKLIYGENTPHTFVSSQQYYKMR